jgi:hypothetical protein
MLMDWTKLGAAVGVSAAGAAFAFAGDPKAGSLMVVMCFVAMIFWD